MISSSDGPPRSRSRPSGHRPSAAPHARQANPAGGWPPQFVHRVVSCRGEMSKMAASRSISLMVKPRWRPSRRPSAAHTVEVLCQPICSLSFAWLHPLRWRRVRMFAPTMAGCPSGMLSMRQRRPGVMLRTPSRVSRRSPSRRLPGASPSGLIARLRSGGPGPAQCRRISRVWPGRLARSPTR